MPIEAPAIKPGSRDHSGERGRVERHRNKTSSSTPHRSKSERALDQRETASAELPEAVKPEELEARGSVRMPPEDLKEVVLRSPFPGDPLPAKLSVAGTDSDVPLGDADTQAGSRPTLPGNPFSD
jgi:hypothetical protein